MQDDKILLWFAKNVLFSHSKLIPIPIGLQNRYVRRGNHSVITKFIKNANNYKKKNLCYVNFNINTNVKERVKAFKHFKDKSYCRVCGKTPYEKNFINTIESEFTICPPGNGFDCHRQWEGLYLGAFPIVLSTENDSIFDDLPVVLVKDWNEVNERFLREKRKELSQKTYKYEKLYIQYWLDFIDEHRKNACLDQAI